MRKVMTFLMTLLFIQVLAGCGKGPGETSAMRYIGFKVYDPAYIAKDMGFFEENGVDVEIIDLVAGGPNAIQAVSGGGAEAGMSSYMGIINARSAGLDIMAVSDFQSSIGNQALEEFFVRKDSGIETVADLSGKKIAINLAKSSFHYTWLMALENAGLTEGDVEFVLLPFDQQEMALERGQVDAIGLMQPYTLHAAENLALAHFMSALDVFGERQFTTHLVNRAWAEYNPDAAKGFVSAIAQACNWVGANQDEAKEIISKYTGVEVKYIEDYHFQPDAKIVKEDARFWLDFMVSHGDIEAGQLTVSDFATNRYNPRAE